MTPAARTAAAIELLSEIERTGRPVDVAARFFFRARRYAGSGDRRFIIGLVYDSFRERGQALHEITASGLEPTDRRLVLWALKATVEDPSPFFDGSQYGPPGLSDEEQSLFDGESEDEVGAIWPLWMQDEVTERFGDQASEEMFAMNERPGASIRANTLTTTREKVLAKLKAADIEATASTLAPHGISLGRDLTAAETGFLDAKTFSIQDEGSQIAAWLVDAKPGMQVIDYCAGAGGKTLALAAAMENSGQIHAFDVDEGRLKELARRVKEAKVRNVQTLLLTDKTVKIDADRVLVDAPCTGSGTWRRHPEGKWLIKAGQIEGAVVRQREIIQLAARLVRKGGRLIYVTCSIFPAENEAIVAGFLADHADFELREAATLWQEMSGAEMPENVRAGPEGKAVFLSPMRTGTDAFYVAVLERKEA